MGPLEAVVRTASRPAHAAAGVLGTAAGLLTRAEAAMARLEALIDRVEQTDARARAVVDRVDDTSQEAAESVSLASEELRRTLEGVAEHRSTLAEAGATLGHAARTARPEHVDAVERLLELVPDLLDLVVPALRGMADVSPELGRLAERADTVGQIVEGLPGAGSLRRRGADGP